MLPITRGFLITFEGIDGCGKTTLTASIIRLLQEQGFPIVATREPGQTPLGVQLRTLVQERSVPICPQAEYLLFATNRAQHFHELVLPALEQNMIVISDRMADSSLVYQGYARGLGVEVIRSINAWTMNNRMPDLVVYVRVPVEVAFERIKRRGGELSSFEREREAFTRKVFEGYEALVAGRDDVLVVDGQLEPAQLAEVTLHRIIERMQQAGVTQ